MDALPVIDQELMPNDSFSYRRIYTSDPYRSLANIGSSHSPRTLKTKSCRSQRNSQIFVWAAASQRYRPLGYISTEAAAGAVTLIQRFGPALKLPT
jgi:hypothetical protein